VRVILDTNVLMSGLFFGGVPGIILEAWKVRRISVVYTSSILGEYQRVAESLRHRYPDRDANPLLALLLTEGVLVDDVSLSESVSRDPDDDKFLACAVSSGTPIVISGDFDLLDVDGYKGVEVLKPRRFVDRYLTA
jgi:uncharacterized protein